MYIQWRDGSKNGFNSNHVHHREDRTSFAMAILSVLEVLPWMVQCALFTASWR